MKFRIIKYYNRYKAQLFKDEWIDIGSPTGYYDINSSKKYCKEYKEAQEEKIVEEFEL